MGLLEYTANARQMRRAGYDDEAIRRALSNSGATKEEIQTTMDALDSPDLTKAGKAIVGISVLPGIVACFAAGIYFGEGAAGLSLLRLVPVMASGVGAAAATFGVLCIFLKLMGLRVWEETKEKDKNEKTEQPERAARGLAENAAVQGREQRRQVANSGRTASQAGATHAAARPATQHPASPASRPAQARTAKPAPKQPPM